MKWQNSNKIGAVGGVDLVNYSELYHPLSHHNTASGTGTLSMFPSDVNEAAGKLQFVQNGFYNKQALEMKNTYQPNSVGILRSLDTRLARNPTMLSRPNETVMVNQDLMAEI